MQTPHKAELFSLAVILLGAGAEISDLLPSKYGGVVLALWAVTRVYLRVTGNAALVEEAKTLGQELHKDVQITQAKPAQKP